MIEDYEFQPQVNSDKLESIFEEMKNYRCIGSTGFKTLDGYLDGGLYPGVYTLAGSPGTGKTTLALQIADCLAEQGNYVLFFSQEMNLVQVISKSIARIASSISGNPILAKDIWSYYQPDNKQAEKFREIITNGIEEYKSKVAPQIDTEAGRVSSDDVVSAMAKMKDYAGVSPVLVIDYLQIMDASDCTKGANDNQQHSANMKVLADLAVQYSTPVLLISSQNRENRHKVDLISLAGTSLAEYGSSVVMILSIAGDTEEEQFQNMQQSERELTLNIVKNRYGCMGKVPLIFNAQTNTFKEKCFSESICKTLSNGIFSEC